MSTYARPLPPTEPLMFLRYRLARCEDLARYYDAAEAGQWSRERDDRQANEATMRSIGLQIAALQDQTTATHHEGAAA